MRHIGDVTSPIAPILMLPGPVSVLRRLVLSGTYRAFSNGFIEASREGKGIGGQVKKL
jgi:hypothetical protein